MSEKTIYGLVITKIINCLHECSKVTEAIECKTEFTQRGIPTEAMNQSKTDIDQVYSTPLAVELARIKQTAEDLLKRLIDLDSSICSTAVELENSVAEKDYIAVPRW